MGQFAEVRRIITTCFNSRNVSFNQWGSLRLNKLIRKKLIFKYNLAAVAELVPHWRNHFWAVWKSLLNKPSFFEIFGQVILAQWKLTMVWSTLIRWIIEYLTDIPGALNALVYFQSLSLLSFFRIILYN